MAGVTVRATHDGSMERGAMSHHDFDFIFGEWNVHNRKIVDNTDPDCDEWIEFDAAAHAEPIFGGVGHFDRMFVPASSVVGEFEGITIRQFDPEAGVWRIWWTASTAPGRIDPPMEGTWFEGRGVFFGDDVIAGRAVRLRFVWTVDGPDRARWEQSFSYDGGDIWTLNWVMDFSRRQEVR
ncbi:hypothetical protein GCM10027029_34170 [Conyzicola lurida]